jgi:hypothetical protein
MHKLWGGQSWPQPAFSRLWSFYLSGQFLPIFRY